MRRIIFVLPVVLTGCFGTSPDDEEPVVTASITNKSCDLLGIDDDNTEYYEVWWTGSMSGPVGSFTYSASDTYSLWQAENFMPASMEVESFKCGGWDVDPAEVSTCVREEGMDEEGSLEEHIGVWMIEEDTQEDRTITLTVETIFTDTDTHDVDETTVICLPN